ncbi:MAG: AAA family ATPase [Candidatus Omnitrophota bacterium]
MGIKNIAGQPVRGDSFFNRAALVREFKQKITNGSSILISAPRRVGKTSLMFHLHDKGMKGFYFIYLITESVNNENEYFKHILGHVLNADFIKTFKKYSKKASQFLNYWTERITQIGGVSLAGGNSLNYKDEFVKLIKEIDLEGNKLVLMVDEFPQTVENIIEDEGEREAIRFLQSSHELRQNGDISNKLQFVFAGSIGLENIVSRLNCVNLVNDLVTLRVPPLSEAESKALVRSITRVSPFSLSAANIDYILEKIEWHIPFYIQLTVQEISYMVDPPVDTEDCSEKKKKAISKKLIDEAFDKLLDLRIYFEHWQTRLRKAFKKEEYSFAKELLNMISQKENIRTGDIIDLAHKFNVPDDYKDIVNALTYDGYINHNDDPQIYRFNSPLLKMWWLRNVAY